MPGRDDLTIRVIRDEADWDAIRPEWSALYAECPRASTPLDHAWLRAWWQVFGATYGAGGLRIVTMWRASQLVAALPLYVGSGHGARFGMRVVRFLSTGETEDEEICPDYLDLLARPGDEAACASAAWREVGAWEWDQLEWLDMPADSPLLRDGVAPRGADVFDRGACPIADLTGAFKGYLGRLSSNGRQQARHMLREAEAAGAQFEIVGADGAGRAFDDLCRLHQARWAADGMPGVFAAPRFVAFHRQIIEQWVPTGRAVLARLDLNGEPVAVLYGFITGGKFDFYQSGVRFGAGVALRSPGNLAHLRLMQALSARGIGAYDFLRGGSSYKERLATRDVRLAGVRVWRSTPRAIAARAREFAAQTVRRSAMPPKDRPS
jgi:CelD/BcsL family acetyltransferase involved in cellulose biosynthesis